MSIRNWQYRCHRILASNSEHLSEQYNGFAGEIINFETIIKDWEVKYRAMHDQLTSENKLLTGKLNSLEESRIQKDELIKFNQQKNTLREQIVRYKEMVYELERTQILDENRLKNVVGSRLLQLSNEFLQTNDIRIAAHVQRLFRENIALNNELGCLLHNQQRLKGENEVLSKKITEQGKNFNSMQQACQKHIVLISNLSTECEKMRKQSEWTAKTEKLKQMNVLQFLLLRKFATDNSRIYLLITNMYICTH